MSAQLAQDAPPALSNGKGEGDDFQTKVFSTQFPPSQFGCTFALPLADRSLRKFEHYKFHEEQQRIFVASQEAACQRNSAAAASSSSLNYHPHLHQHRSSPLAGFTNHHHHHQQQQRPLLENSGSGSSSGNMEHLVKMKAAAAAAAVAAAASASFSPTSSAAAASRQSGHSKSTLEGKSSLASGGKPPRSPPTLQVFPTGTTLTSVDGLPVLKRKRGRPPKNRVSEVQYLSICFVLNIRLNLRSPFFSLSYSQT